MSKLNLYDRVAKLRQELEDEPPMPSTRRTYIEDETSWASQFLAGLAWILPSIHHKEDDDDVIYDG